LLLAPIFLSRFLIKIVPIFMLFSAAGVAGLFGSWALKTGDANDIPFFVFNILICGCYVALFDFSLSFLGGSPYLSSSPFAFFSTSTYRFHAVGTPIFLFLAMSGVDFGLWFRLVLVVLHIGFWSGADGGRSSQIVSIMTVSQFASTTSSSAPLDLSLTSRRRRPAFLCLF
jgi:uncharacterized membrane protein